MTDTAAPAIKFDNLLTITEAAAEQMKRALSAKPEAAGILFDVSMGGCAGMEYVMSPVEAPPSDAISQDFHGVQVFIAPKAVLYLRNLEVDFSHDLLDSGFKFRNPNATDTCGCGTSFNIKK